MERMWALGGFDGFRRKQGCTWIYLGSDPERIKTYILLVWSCIACIVGPVIMIRRWDLAMVEKRWRALAYAWDLCEIRYLCEIILCQIRDVSRGCPWWLYICSQLGFTSIFAFYFKSKCWALRASCILRAGFFLDRNRIGKYRGPRGHTLVSSPRVSSRFVESGRDSNLALKS
jgi:hypothetical protein